MRKEEATEVLSIDGRKIRVTNPDKLYFSKETKISKLDLVRYYLSWCLVRSTASGTAPSY